MRSPAPFTRCDAILSTYDAPPQRHTRKTVNFGAAASARLKDLQRILDAPTHADILRGALAFYATAVTPRPAASIEQRISAEGPRLCATYR